MDFSTVDPALSEDVSLPVSDIILALNGIFFSSLLDYIFTYIHIYIFTYIHIYIYLYISLAASIASSHASNPQGSSTSALVPLTEDPHYLSESE